MLGVFDNTLYVAYTGVVLLMVFSSPVFLFIFLPVVITVYYIVRGQWREFWLLAASLFFYAWNYPPFLFILLASTLINYSGALVIGWSQHQHKKDDTPRCFCQSLHWVVFIATIVLNLIFLYYFKYYNFTVHTINKVFSAGFAEDVILPIGISFFTFQGISYVVDVFRGAVPAQKNIAKFAMYISMFPQLVAGPIVRYSDIEQQIAHRDISLNTFASGLERFIIGLFRKVVIADSLAIVADGIFGLDAAYRTTTLAWLGLVAYSLQIYYDFSGYSDMAIGMGHMLGFHFRENFNFPYISKSITEFWSRWHISLSTFFRDYVYIPMGGNKNHAWRNIAIVFLLTGIWHGAGITFILWGIWHGAFRLLEKAAGVRRDASNSSLFHTICAHVYGLAAVMFGWVLFRSNTLPNAIKYYRSLFGCMSASDAISWEVWCNNWVIMILCIALVWATPVFSVVGSKVAAKLPLLVRVTAKYIGLILMLTLCILRVASGTYTAFIYFQF